MIFTIPLAITQFSGNKFENFANLCDRVRAFHSYCRARFRYLRFWVVHQASRYLSATWQRRSFEARLCRRDGIVPGSITHLMDGDACRLHIHSLKESVDWLRAGISHGIMHCESHAIWRKMTEIQVYVWLLLLTTLFRWSRFLCDSLLSSPSWTPPAIECYEFRT